MRITPLDLLLGTSRLQRRINTELAQLPHDIAAVRNRTHELRNGVAHKATSLPMLAIAAASGFVIAKLARSTRLQTGIGALTGTLAWQLLMPVAYSWIQAAMTPAAQRPEAI